MFVFRILNAGFGDCAYIEVCTYLLQTSAIMDSMTLVSVVTNYWKSCLMQNECNGKV